ncbi:conserved hypothetical protein [Pediculus humanus corporis]|uniref:Uncharacterized protein n=1 Tax=Pediculus humanus subsp. corporis TaxID=121224 RepID=E0VW89_PEDHC|nr:uncharacterized protein Phum_PHUM475980 [Pediculus humanus corporis]EEB17645.1 conserved hypothetical protein [Pediculus humanus corporis]
MILFFIFFFFYRNADSWKEKPIQNGITKTVFGRWLKDFRTGQNRESVTIQRPLGRTLSANFKEKKDGKKKINRTLSACQKDRKKDWKNDDDNNDWNSNDYHTQYNNNNKQSINGDNVNGLEGLKSGKDDDDNNKDNQKR